MDLRPEGWGEAQRVFGNSENICLEKSVIRSGAKSVSPCQIRGVARGTGNKKPQLRTVEVYFLVAIINMKKRSRVAQSVLSGDGGCLLLQGFSGLGVSLP